MTIGACIATILETIDVLGASLEPSQALECLDSLNDIMKSLNNWRDARTTDIFQQQDPGLEKSLATDDILYSDITEANSLTQYWAFCIICAVQALSLQQQLGGARPLPVELAIPNTTLESNAIAVMRSVRYLTRVEVKLYGAISLMLPLKVSYEYLETQGGSSFATLRQRVTDNIRLTGHHYLNNFVSSDLKILWPRHNVN